jgi:glycosyltransferase involved in cell wall biosynthesis
VRLGFHYHIPAIEKHGKIYLPGYLGVFIDSLAQECAQVVCFLHTPRPAERQRMDYEIRSSNVCLVSIGARRSVPLRTLFAFLHTRPISDWRGKLDAFLIRGPSPLLPQIARAAAPVPVVLLLVGDYLAGVDNLPQPGWRKELIRLWSTWNNRGQLQAARRGLTFVNSHKLYRDLEGQVARLVEIHTTTLSQADFYERSETGLSHPLRILYTGRLDRAKGLFEMVQAVALLTRRGEEVVLELAGWPEPGDTILAELQSLARELGVDERLHYLGFKPLGPELFACYRQADLYVIAIASKSSEGFPRTIWEAMANSLPVIATQVGSIPDFIEGAALLIPPADPAALAEAIQRLAGDPALYRELAMRGLVLARQNTLESQAHKMVLEIDKWLSNKK